MKIKDGYMLCKVGDSHIVIATGNASMNLSGLTTLNETAAFIWEQLQTETDEAAVTQAVMSEFEVDESTAAQDVHALVMQFKEAGFLG